MSKTLKKLKPLKIGSLVAIVAPGSPADETQLQAGVRELEARGYKVKLDTSSDDFKFASASPETRAKALMSAFSDKEVGAILSARGGYGKCANPRPT